ncbi:hypothetical protein [Celerinatantimonas yamalensis]|uniref:Uncharacterized protein n=1 Tax=Celerinatantimonas yamalensis TaxID=559956 RepID=A0ABW9G7Y5_9GAMM
MNDFKALNQRQKDGFAQQQRWLKQVLAGKLVNCPSCQQTISADRQGELLHLHCCKGCTDVVLTLG